MDWFLCDRDLLHERVKSESIQYTDQMQQSATRAELTNMLSTIKTIESTLPKWSSENRLTSNDGKTKIYHIFLKQTKILKR